MPDPTLPPAAPAAPTTPAVPDPSEPKKASLLSNILNLVAPEKADVKPVVPAEPAKAPDAIKTPDPVKAPDAPATPDATPAPEPEKKVVVKSKPTPPAGPTADEVRRIAAEEAAKATAVAKPAVVAPPAPDDSDLTAAEQEELALARLAEQKDPTRKGLSDKFRSFYKQQTEFLEKRMAAEGETYDPAQDPEFKRFLAKNEPKLPAAERKALRDEQVAATAERRALDAADKKYAPEIDRLRQKTLELEHRPAIRDRVTKYSSEISEGMPEEIVKFFNENGRSIEKTREAFPGEFDIVVQSINGATVLAEEALALRKGLTKFDPTNGKHEYLDSFLRRQADVLLTRPATERVRDGKTFVHPYQWEPKMADKHWTFDDEDVLGMIKTEAQREAKTRVSSERERVKKGYEAYQRRTTAPVGATPPVAPVVTPSSRTPPGMAPGNAASAPKPSSGLTRLLGLG